MGTNGKTYKLSKYRAEAKTEPFPLEVDENETLLIPVPDSDTVLDIEEAGSSRRMLELMCGEHSDRVFELIGPEPGSVITDLARDMARHFGISPEQAPPGGSRASRRS